MTTSNVTANHGQQYKHVLRSDGGDQRPVVLGDTLYSALSMVLLYGPRGRICRTGPEVQ
jgi:hypothetical protein